MSNNSRLRADVCATRFQEIMGSRNRTVNKLKLRAPTISVALILCAAGWSSSLFAADRIKLALPAKSMGYLPLFVASHRGFLKDENIEIEMPMMLPQLAHNALLNGEVDYHGVADSALRLAARGAPIKTIFFGAIPAQLFLDGQAAGEIDRRVARQIHRHRSLRRHHRVGDQDRS